MIAQGRVCAFSAFFGRHRADVSAVCIFCCPVNWLPNVPKMISLRCGETIQIVKARLQVIQKHLGASVEVMLGPVIRASRLDVSFIGVSRLVFVDGPDVTPDGPQVVLDCRILCFIHGDTGLRDLPQQIVVV